MVSSRSRPYLEALPDIIRYQIVTKAVLGFWLFLLGRLFRILLYSAGRVAVTSGDFLFLFGTWQGILILLVALASLFLYIALDLNAMIILSRNLLTGKRDTIRNVCLQAVHSISRFLNIRGLGIAFYILLIAPVIGIGFSITLTKGFYIPTFISSVIADTPLYLFLASVVALFFISFGIANLFILHGIVIDGLSVKDAGQQSRSIIRKNWKDYFRQNTAFILIVTGILVIVACIVLALPLFLTNILPLNAGLKRGLTVFFFLQGVIISLIAGLIITPFYIMKTIQLYYTYKNGEPFTYTGGENGTRALNKFVLIPALIAVILSSVFLNRNFDDFFPKKTDVRIIAHRGGGVEGAENTVSGLISAWQIGAYGSEIDIQRTRDGHYILNHDGDFSRVAGDGRSPEEMTLDEIRKLSVDGELIPTLEEILDASRGKVILFIELKGNTADTQMADDAVRIVKERHMEDETVFISLQYDLIDYIETKYPEMETGFLSFVSFGDTAFLNCDYLALEEESATAGLISSIHEQGKKVLIWTVNEKRSQRHFLCSEADALITDNVSQAMDMIDEINGRSVLRRIIDRIGEYFS